MKKMWLPLAGLIVILIAVTLQTAGVRVPEAAPGEALLDRETFAALRERGEAERADAAPECLILFNQSEPLSLSLVRNTTYVLDRISVEYELTQAAETVPGYARYKTVIVAFSDLARMGDGLMELCDWVRAGGSAFIAMPPDYSASFRALASRIGLNSTQYEFRNQVSLRVASDFLPWAAGREYLRDAVNGSVLAATLDDACTVHLSSADADAIPLLWERNYGSGRFVVNNSGILYTREGRGVLAAAYSLLPGAFAYPVVNAASYFIDDWPAPVREGYDARLFEQYGMSIAEFFTSVWWPDMQKLSDAYGLRYTGLCIETYNDETEAPFAEEPVTQAAKYAGAMVLVSGGEIGLHGYNHQPLCLTGFDYLGELDYETYPAEADMRQALTELLRYARRLFPENEYVTYVPPSNVLSAEAHALIAREFPEIRVISGILFAENYEYEQEFSVSPDGIVNVPRVVSGCAVNEYMQWCSDNALAFQFVSSHFLHPDDVLDEERGAALGWEAMYGSFSDYVENIAAIPGLRPATAGEAAAAVQRYDALGADTARTKDGLSVTLTGFHDRASLLVRINEGAPGQVTGGTLTKLGSTLYLLEADAADVFIEVIP